MDIRQILDHWYTNTVNYLPNLILIAVILLLTIVVSRRTQGLVRRLSGRTQAPAEIVDLLGRIARFAVLLVGLLLVLDRLNLSGAVLSFVAGLGIAGIVIGFALQDIVKQFAAGVLLLMLRPFRVGDQVKIDDFEGRVVEVQLRATVLKTAGGDEVLIPNADVYSTAIVNMSRYNLRRHTIALSVPPETDLARGRAALIQALSGIPGIAPDPPPSIVATGLDGQAVELELRFWIDERASNPETVTTGVIAATRRALEQRGNGEVKG
jgi:small conductance mechanosensitive channel